jgi:hypothetical protein
MSLGLTTEQMAGVIDVLAVELAPLETMRKKATERQSRYRQRDSNVTVDVTPSPLVPPLSPAPLSPPIIPPSQLQPDGFAEFWDAYPKRDGGADKKGALKAFGPAVQRAGGKGTILRAVARYAAHCREKGKVGTEFVKQARSWLNGDLWTEWLPQELPPEVASSRVYVTTGTDAMDAWDDHFKRTRGKLAPRDQRGGWWFDSEYPPSQQEQAA